MPKRKTNRAAQGSGTIRQRKDGRWEARYTVGRNPGTGKQIQKSVYGDTQAEVRKKLAQATAAIDEGVFMEPSRLTLGAWLDIWLAEYVENAVKPLTYHSYMEQCKNHIKPALGAVKLSALNAHAIQKFYNTLHKGNDNAAGLSAKTVKNIHGVLHSALKQAVALGYIKYNPTEACTLPRVVKKEIKPLEEVEIFAFLEAIEGHKYETLYLVTLFTGLRKSEALGMTWDCVDFENGVILINKQLQKEKEKGGTYYFASLKNDKTRCITPAPSVMAALRNHKIKQAEMRLLAGQAWENNKGLVFTNELGGNLTHVTVFKQFKTIVAKLGLPDTRVHDLRHSYAVMSLQAGDDVKTVQENLGHHTAAFTLDVYGHVSEKMKRDSAARMESFIKGIKKGV